MEPFEGPKKEIVEFFDAKLAAHGPTPQGLDLNSVGAQTVRFAQIVRILDPGEEVSILDYGCGYGGLVAYLEEQGFSFRYSGFDIAESMVAEARRLFPENPGRQFTSRPEDLLPCDFVVSSSIFNKRGTTPVASWEPFVMDAIDRMASLSRRGFAFNMLTSYSDPARMRDDLYYGDPCRMFDLCKRKYSRNVALLHDYGIYDFTILVRL
jgi:SAM-dependent methyltransferase